MVPEILRLAAVEADKTFNSTSLESAVCTYVFRRLEDLGANIRYFDLGGLSGALGWREPEQAKAVIAALDHLAFCSYPVLSRKFALWPKDATGVLEQPLCTLNDREIRNALENGVLADPITGEGIADFADRITVEYWVLPAIGDALALGGGDN